MPATSLFGALALAWRREFNVYTACDRDSAELRARHLNSVTRLTPLMVLANVGNAAIVALAFDGVPLLHRMVWLSVLLALCGIGLRAWWRRRDKAATSVSPRAARHATIGAALLGIVWGGIAVAWFPGASPPQQLLLTGLILGTMCGGAFALAPLPMAALAQLGTLSLGSSIALLRDHGPATLYLMLLLLLYVAVLAISVLATARVFTARLRSEREASRQGHLIGLLLRDFEEHSADVLWECGAGGLLTHVSPRLSAALGSSAAELQGGTLLDALASRRATNEADSHLAALRTSLNLGQAFRDLVVPVQTASNGLRWWSFSAKPLVDELGHHAGWRGVISDVTQARETHRRLAYLAHFDSLTGLANRLELREQLARAMEVSAAPDAPPLRTALMCLDVDHFKSINDTLGHAAGDAVLAEVGRRLQSCLRQADLAARLGGDEFALVITDVRSDDEVAALARRLVQVLCQPCEVAGRQVALGTSIGVAIAPDHGRTLDELMGNADLALYAAKEAGRARFEIFVPRLGDRRRRRVAIEQALRGALSRSEMHLHWQPRVDVSRWEVVGAEVLLRWQHPELGRINPDEFIGIAEDAGLIAEIGLWVLQRACAHAVQMPPHLLVSVNVSPAQLQREDFAALALRAIERSGLPPQRLELEVTESLFMDETSAQALANLHALRNVGVRIALDDFGTGYSSLAYLRRFPFDTLKIDRAFVRELMTRHDARAIVRTILELAKTLGMETIAEGVEEPAQLDVLREAGCGSIQGFMVARPMPRGDFLRLMKNWTTPGTAYMGLDLDIDSERSRDAA
ncbi:EAL domain-containing protein [Aquincola sp. S2]|uniref:EAL domain-containing protein n=1 Tax=Pseudaquabacterium terrae TaxID=2732868 RepID=A0ABX2EGU2_9BURK|nr:EAL domain-containing protein [Aquabacterium terrae]NRF67850.1 EAL domain-containing protein [Aquabacterium terrae]